MAQQPEKRRRITAAQWLAARALSEGAPPTRRRVAAVLGCDDSVVYARAGEEGWKKLDFRTQAAQDAHADFIDRVAAAGVWNGAGGRSADSSTQDEEGKAAGAAERTLEEALSAAAGTGDGSQADGAGRASLSTGAEEDPLALLARAARVLARRLADLLSRAEAGGRLNKAEIDGLLALARMTERWETLARERAKKEETQSDEQLAETLRIIDDRIIELAEAEAARLVAAGYRPGDGGVGD